ncbi:VOC family protein [Hoeflea sp.]|uniref:VOC family protein n=1 Tax=Hoeflea sp. TaxID=1940281 RepID=UPI003A9490EB
MVLIPFARHLGVMVLAFNFSAFPAFSEPIDANRFGLYVVADEMHRAAVFYEQLFGVPEVKMPSLLGFNVAGGFFAVVSRETYAADAVTGDTMRAYIDVGDIEESFERVQAVAPNRLESAAVIVEGPFRFFRVRDPDNNVLEFFSIDLAPKSDQ